MRNLAEHPVTSEEVLKAMADARVLVAEAHRNAMGSIEPIAISVADSFILSRIADLEIFIAEDQKHLRNLT